jgi:anti-anti-sigma factor
MVPSFSCAFDEQTRTLTVTGLVDVAAAVEVRRLVIAHATAHRASLSLDLTQVEALSNAAIGVLASARAELRAHFLFLKMVAAQGSVASRVLPDNGMAVFEA